MTIKIIGYILLINRAGFAGGHKQEECWRISRIRKGSSEIEGSTWAMSPGRAERMRGSRAFPHKKPNRCFIVGLEKMTLMEITVWYDDFRTFKNFASRFEYAEKTTGLERNRINIFICYIFVPRWQKMFTSFYIHLINIDLIRPTVKHRFG